MENSLKKEPPLKLDVKSAEVKELNANNNKSDEEFVSGQLCLPFKRQHSRSREELSMDHLIREFKGKFLISEFIKKQKIRKKKRLYHALRTKPKTLNDSKPRGSQTGQPDPTVVERKGSIHRCSSADVLVSNNKGLSLSDRISKLKASFSQDFLRKCESAPNLPQMKELALDPLIHAELLPPINRFTLRELSYEKIVNNQQIRHDLAFEEQLEFSRKAADGRSASESKYWSLIENEISCLESRKAILTGSFNFSDMSESLSGGNILVVLLIEIKEILLETLPYSSSFYKKIQHAFDFSFLHQQVSCGVIDLAGILLPLTNLLRSHCAPIRDKLVTQIQSECIRKSHALALKNTMELLQLMKLDIANDQLRSFKPFAIKNAVEYERRQLDRLLKVKGSLAFERTELWLSRLAKTSATFQPMKKQVDVPAYLELFTLNSFLIETLPETFILDATRLQEYSKEWHRLGLLGCIAILLRQIAGKEQIMETLIKKLYVILVVPSNSQPKEIVELCLEELETLNSLKISEEFAAKLESAMSKVLSADSPLFDLISVRLGSYFFICIKNKQNDLNGDELMKDLNAIRIYAAKLAMKLSKLFWHNLAVHDRIYCDILEQIDK